MTHLSIRGLGPLLTEQDVLAWLGVSRPPRIWDFSPARVKQRLELHPQIEQVSVRREFPNLFEIEIEQRHPEAIVVLNHLYYVGRGGVLLRAVDRTHNPDFPLITGLSTEVAAGYRAAALRRVQRLVRLCTRISCLGGISEIRLDEKLGVIIYPVEPRVAVVLGWGSWRDKLGRAARVIDAWQGQHERLASVDLRFRNQVVVRTRGGLPVPSVEERKGKAERRA